VLIVSFRKIFDTLPLSSLFFSLPLLLVEKKN
jgi:hypothetical protein